MKHPLLPELLQAQERIRPYIHRTPVLSSEGINRLLGAGLLFKCENLQKVGAFKARGACNAVFQLSEEEGRQGVATHSSGNHGQALAWAAAQRGFPAYVVMPENAPRVKVNAVRGYGAEVVFCQPTLAARESTLEDVVTRTGAHVVHPFDDWRVICGQSTCALEFLEQTPDLDLLLAPVGGGGLMAGTLLAAAYRSPSVRVIAAEPAGADDAYRSWKEGRRIPLTVANTVADGLRTSLGEKNFSVLQQYADRVISVQEETILRAMRLIWERMKLVVEPSAAVPLAAVLENPELFVGKKTGIILSGGNVDLEGTGIF